MGNTTNGQQHKWELSTQMGNTTNGQQHNQYGRQHKWVFASGQENQVWTSQMGIASGQPVCQHKWATTQMRVDNINGGAQRFKKSVASLVNN
jgi:hypothetical protein